MCAPSWCQAAFPEVFHCGKSARPLWSYPGAHRYTTPLLLSNLLKCRVGCRCLLDYAQEFFPQYKNYWCAGAYLLLPCVEDRGSRCVPSLGVLASAKNQQKPYLCGKGFYQGVPLPNHYHIKLFRPVRGPVFALTVRQATVQRTESLYP